MPAILARRVKEHARELGFNLVGLIPARPSPRLTAYLDWLAAGMQGAMGYLSRPDRIQRRRDLTAILPGARTLIMVGLDYHLALPPEALLTDPSRGRMAMYAWGQDYHEVMTARLQTLAAELEGARHKVYVDTGALLERSHAQQAGLGFVGRNTMLIHPRRGSDFFLGEIITHRPP